MDTTAQDRAAQREAMLAKIRALRAKTESAGANEHEALAAAEKAAELMESYGVTEDDLAAMRETRHAWAKGAAGMSNGRIDHRVTYCVAPIARLTQTRAVLGRRQIHGEWQRAAEYFGEPADVALAVWLQDTIRLALDNEYDRYRKERERVGTGAKAAFQIGMAGRINFRIAEIVKARNAARPSDSRALVVCKDQLVQEAWHEAYPRLSRGRAQGPQFNPHQSAYGAGQQAGDRVGLGRPLDGTAQALRIGQKA